MKGIRHGIMRKKFDLLPVIQIRWFIGFEGKRKFDICFSWLCFYAQTNNYGKDWMAKLEKTHAEFRTIYNNK